MEHSIPEFAATVHHWFCKEQSPWEEEKKEKESVNLIAEEWNHKTVSWVGSVATQSQMGEQTIVKVIPVPFLNPRASKKQLDKNSFSHAIRPCLVPLMLQWQYKSKTFYLVSLVV